MSTSASGDSRVAVVTGGAGAIGGALAACLASDHTVVVLNRTGDVVVDLADTDDVRQAAELALDRYGRCDVLVHAAAMVKFQPFDQLELDVWRQVQAVNVESALLLTQAFAPGMRDRGFGRVILIVSNTFWSPPGIHMLSYVASKGALIGMARTLAVGLGSDGIAVTAVAPGLTRTPATIVVPAAEFADTEAHQALPRPLTPDGTAAVVAMLARDEAAALTGQTLIVDEQVGWDPARASALHLGRGSGTLGGTGESPGPGSAWSTTRRAAASSPREGKGRSSDAEVLTCPPMPQPPWAVRRSTRLCGRQGSSPLAQRDYLPRSAGSTTAPL